MDEIRNVVFKEKKREYLSDAILWWMCSVVVIISGYFFFLTYGMLELLSVAALGSGFLSIYGGFKFNQYIIARTVEELVYYDYD